jgi:nitrogen regulatory protein PII
MKFVALAVIASNEYEDSLKAVAKEAGATGVTVLQARGSGYEEKKSFFSLTFEGNHSFLLYILEENVSRLVLKALKHELENTPAKGLAFTMPIGNIVGLNHKMIKTFEEKMQEEGVL